MAPEDRRERGFQISSVRPDVAISVVSLANLFFLIYIDATQQKHGNPYLGILTLDRGAGILIFGLALYIVASSSSGAGGGCAARRISRSFAHRSQLAAHAPEVIFISIGLLAFVTMLGLGSYHAFHYTESDASRGTLCIRSCTGVTRVQTLAARARRCVGCHVGPGAHGLSGPKLSVRIRSIRSSRKSIREPIPSPVHSLRPAAGDLRALPLAGRSSTARS